MPRSALAIAAHPDDIEFLMSGTLMRLAAVGFEIHYFNLANGCCGSTLHGREQTAAIRREEARRAAASIGAHYHESLVNDLEIIYTPELVSRVCSVVRWAAPEIVLTHAPCDYMDDHEQTCRLAVTAAFCRGMPNFPVVPPRAALAGPTCVYHAQPYGNRDRLGQVVRPTHFVDVADLMPRKTAMLAEHASQHAWLDASQGLSSYLQTMHDLAAEVGRMSPGFACAEGWRRHLHLGLCGPTDDPLAEALGSHLHRAEK